jgi:hypothetical protein
MSLRTPRSLLSSLLLSVTVLCAGGCQVPAALWYRTVGPPPIPARFAPPKDQPLLVLGENVHSGSHALPEADDLARVVYDDLKENKVAPMVDPAALHDLRDRNAIAFSKMSISEVGRQVGARLIIYVNVNELNIENPPGSEMVKAKLKASVKVIDVATARTLWPENGAGEPYDFESRLQRVTDQSTRSVVNRQVLRDSGQQIARWFYDFKPETMGEENQDLKLR